MSGQNKCLTLKMLVFTSSSSVTISLSIYTKVLLEVPFQSFTVRNSAYSIRLPSALLLILTISTREKLTVYQPAPHPSFAPHLDQCFGIYTYVHTILSEMTEEW